MNFHQYLPNDLVNGDGLRATLFVSGCSHGCKGCYNTETWNPKSGQPLTKEIKDQIISDLKGEDGVNRQGLSISGGDPLHEDNIHEVFLLCSRVLAECPGKDIWLWTGYTKEQVDENYRKFDASEEDIGRALILGMVDRLIDGRFVKDLHTPTLKYRGSSNQNVYKRNGLALERIL